MSTAPSPGLTPEFAAAYRQIVCEGLLNELETTKKVLAAIPDAKRDYRPDSKSRTAWELAWHIASEDVQFLEQITEGKFTFPDPRYEREKPNNVAELVAWYDKETQAGNRAPACHDTGATGVTDQLPRAVQPARGALFGLHEQPQHPSPRSTGDVPATDGIEGALDLWRQRRRALRDASHSIALPCHPERARPRLARESKDPY